MGPSALLVALFALAPGETSDGVGVPAQPSPSTDAPEEPTRLRLQWSAPPSCPPEGDARELVEALTGARLVDDGPHEADADVRIEPRGAGFVGRVHGRGPDGEHTRELAADDCGVLSRALALVVAVGLDAVAVASRSDVADEQEALPAPAESAVERGPTAAAQPSATPAEHDIDPASPSADPEALAPTTPARSSDAAPRSRAGLPPGLEIGGRVAIGVGGLVLPSAGLGVQGGPYLGTRRVHVHLVAGYWTARTIELLGDRSASADLRLATAGVRGCGLLERGRVRVPLCAGVDGGAVLARGHGAGLSIGGTARAPWAAVIVQPGVALRVAPWFSVWLAFEGAISLYRPRFRFEGMAAGEDLFVVGPFAPRGFVGIELHAPR